MNQSAIQLEQRALPHHDEAERVLLGGMLLDGGNVPMVLQQVGVEDFYRRQHQLIFAALVKMFETDQEIDSVLVSDELVRAGQLHEVGGYEYLDELTQGIPRTTNIEYYAGIVKEKSMLRRLAQLGTQIVDSALLPETVSIDAIAQAENALIELRQGKVSHGFREIETLLSESFALIEARSKTSGLVGITSGFVDFDRMTNGLQKGDLIIVAARPAMGKTSFCLNVALNSARLAGAKVAVFSLEMPASQLIMRLLGSEARIGISALRSGQLAPQDWQSLGLAINDLNHTKLFIDDSGESTVATMRGQLKRLKSEAGVDLVIIDYLQLMSGSALNSQQSRVQEVSAISRGLKLLAKEIDCPVIALSQLSRAAEQRSDHRPQLSDLRESGSIEQDADMVCFLYREDYYTEKKQEQEHAQDDDFGIAELIIAKHRNGPTGKINLAFFKRFTRFENYSDEMGMI